MHRELECKQYIILQSYRRRVLCTKEASEESNVVKVLGCKPDDLSLIAEPMVGGESAPQSPLNSIGNVTSRCTLTQTYDN